MTWGFVKVLNKTDHQYKFLKKYFCLRGLVDWMERPVDPMWVKVRNKHWREREIEQIGR